MRPEGFEPTILASEWRETHALDPAATGIGFLTTTLNTNALCGQNVEFYSVKPSGTYGNN
jgi:hypothetical protein